MEGRLLKRMPALFKMIENMKVDPKFTKKIQDWLNIELKSNDDIADGAQLLFRINPRNVAYRRYLQLAVQRPKSIVGKIEYELKIHLKYRLDGLTLEQVNRLDREVIPSAEKILSAGQPEDGTETVDSEQPANILRLGRRQDHDQLPDEIKQLWEDNGKLYKDIKATFEELKSMEDLPSCQRYDKLQLLASMDKRYMSQMEKYDAFDNTPTKPATPTEPASPKDSESNSSILSARSYISKNTEKLASLLSAAAKEGTAEAFAAANKLRESMQERVNILLAADMVTDKMRSSLLDLGIVFEPSEEQPTSPSEESNDQSDTAAAEASE